MRTQRNRGTEVPMQEDKFKVQAYDGGPEYSF